jgi:hypothetical protein
MNLRDISLREQFEERLKVIGEPRLVSIAVQRPEGAIETITTQDKVQEKIDYILKTYNENFEMSHNTTIKILDFMLV